MQDNGEFVAAARATIARDRRERPNVTLIGDAGTDRVVATADSHMIVLTNSTHLPVRLRVQPGVHSHGIELFEADVIALTDVICARAAPPRGARPEQPRRRSPPTGGTAELRGGARNDSIYGTDGGELINGGAGNDELQGNGGDDTINGGAGLDSVIGGDGDDLLDGGADGEGDFLSGGAGDDRLIVQDNGEFVSGGAGDDRIEIGDDTPNVTLIGDAGTDRVVATADSHMIVLTNLNFSYQFGSASNPVFIPHGIEVFEADVIALTDVDRYRGPSTPRCSP